MHYQIYFRTSRGGTGIPYELAKKEFLTVFSRWRPTVERDWWASRRMWIQLSLPPDRVGTLAADLGYTEAILHLRYEPYYGEDICPIERGRWFTGWVREQEQKVYQTEVYVQDAEALLAVSPNRRTFEIHQNDGRRLAFGHRAHRALSPLDARFLMNIAAPEPTDVILDPFAGYGGLVSEAKRRGHRISASDSDKSLSPGLSALEPDACLVADARSLPFPTGHFDLIVTEPPFRSVYRQDVVDSLTELHRVVGSGGKMILLVARNMCQDILTALENAGTEHIAQMGVIPRGGGLRCPVLSAVSH